MGVVQVTATVRNPADPDRSWDGLFLVDTGTMDTVVPSDALHSIGLVPKGRRSYELADGREKTMDVTSAEIEFMGDFVGATVCFGNDDEPILGLTAMRPTLQIQTLLSEAAHFAVEESTHDEPALFGVTDGKAVGTYLEHKFQALLEQRYIYEVGSSAKGIDFPGLNVDMKVTQRQATPVLISIQVRTSEGAGPWLLTASLRIPEVGQRPNPDSEAGDPSHSVRP